MSSAWKKLAMAGMAAVASSALGGVIYRRMRYQKIKPKPLKAFDELLPEAQALTRTQGIRKP